MGFRRTHDQPASAHIKEPVVATQKVASPYTHPLAEDLGAIVTSAFFMSWGLVLLHSVQGVSGGLAGVGFVLSYLTGWPLSLLYLLVNLPFFYFAVRRMGWAFTIKTFAAISLTSLFTSLQPFVITIQRIEPLYACIFSGLSLGVGMLVIFRHGASAGGFGIVAAYAQERFGWRAGYIQGALDLVVVAAAIPLVNLLTLLYSVIGVVVLDLVLAINHKPGRYRP